MRKNKVIFKFSKPFSKFDKGDEKELNISFARGLQDNDKVGKILPRVEKDKDKLIKQREAELDKREKDVLSRENKIEKAVLNNK